MEGFWVLDKTNNLNTSLWAQRASDGCVVFFRMNRLNWVRVSTSLTLSVSVQPAKLSVTEFDMS